MNYARRPFSVVRDVAPYLPKSILLAAVDGDVCRLQSAYKFFAKSLLYDGAPRGQEFGHKYRAKMFQS